MVKGDANGSKRRIYAKVKNNYCNNKREDRTEGYEVGEGENFEFRGVFLKFLFHFSLSIFPDLRIPHFHDPNYDEVGEKSSYFVADMITTLKILRSMRNLWMHWGNVVFWMWFAPPAHSAIEFRLNFIVNIPPPMSPVSFTNNSLSRLTVISIIDWLY